jgi:hypothetical protein
MPAAKRVIILRISVEFSDGCLQVGDIQMGVDSRGLNVVVAEQKLNVPDARPASQQVCGATVPEAVNIDSQV